MTDNLSREALRLGRDSEGARLPAPGAGAVLPSTRPRPFRGLNSGAGWEIPHLTGPLPLGTRAVRVWGHACQMLGHKVSSTGAPLRGPRISLGPLDQHGKMSHRWQRTRGRADSACHRRSWGGDLVMPGATVTRDGQKGEGVWTGDSSSQRSALP